MKQFKLANILFENTTQFFRAPMLYCFAQAALIPEADNACTLMGPGQYDFTTFFNGLSVMKWQRYTVATEFYLHLEIRGAACSYVQTRAGSYSWYSEPVESTRRQLPVHDGWQALDVPLVIGKDVLVGFILDISSSISIRNSYYYTKLDESQVRPVELALCTTTFKKETYIERNIKLVRRQIIDSSEPIAAHFHMHVVDNGRTLDISTLESPGISVHPNPNAGGSGGFARGMIESMEQTPKATHVLLMDDDVAISPESIIRTFNLLSITNDEYADAFVSGAMMNLDEPDLRWEDTGFMTFDGVCRPLKSAEHMDSLHALVDNELFEPRSDVRLWEDQEQRYAGWWYCVIPMATIEQKGLPLPLFVRFDDIEYSLRCKPKFITMNGICIWHLSFLMKYSAAVERYQITRNAFIARATTGMAPLSDFSTELYHNIQLELKKFNYTNAELALDGLEDFFKGPDFIGRPGVAEQRFIDANKHAEKLVTFDDLRNMAMEQAGVDIDAHTAVDVVRDIPRTKQEAAIDFVSFNGQRFSFPHIEKDKSTVIDAAGWVYPAGKIRRKKTIVAIDLPNHKGVVRHADRARFREVWDRYKKDIKYYKAHKDALYDAYSSACERLISIEFWKQYLGLNK